MRSAPAQSRHTWIEAPLAQCKWILSHARMHTSQQAHTCHAHARARVASNGLQFLRDQVPSSPSEAFAGPCWPVVKQGKMVRNGAPPSRC